MLCYFSSMGITHGSLPHALLCVLNGFSGQSVVMRVVYSTSHVYNIITQSIEEVITVTS